MGGAQSTVQEGFHSLMERREGDSAAGRPPNPIGSFRVGISREIDQDFTDYSQYDFPFENLVLEGGGNRGLAYFGALQVLEEAGIWKNIRRFSGTSAGAITATFLAIGMSTSEAKDYVDQDMRKVFIDHGCGYFSLLPNLLSGYGWNKAESFMIWLGGILKENTGNADITFLEMYCHVKTTPDMSIRKAVRMSMAIPGLFQCVKFKQFEFEDVFIDGGFGCNYPIHCFDGWWLCMESDSAFINKLHDLEDVQTLMQKSERFGTYNERTFGILLYSDTDPEFLEYELNSRFDGKKMPRPSTKLAKKYTDSERKKEESARVKREVLTAADKFLTALRESNLDKNDTIDKKELERAFRKRHLFTPEDARILFGDGVNIDDVFYMLDVDGDGQITYRELVNYLETKGVHLFSKYLGYQRRNIENVGDFLFQLQAAQMMISKRLYVEKRDADRTIGVDTDYVDTADFDLEAEDKLFLIEQGRRGARAFLREFVRNNNMRPRDSQRRSFLRQTYGRQNSAAGGKPPSRPGSRRGSFDFGN
ncbi:PREDICTED: uncharacterized protein LOC109486195 [Branchiostoma belcheri]|uniref:Uncharacterized protein LOC109486195 n=2 Tax=Branchiostoma belcheri TaxID=7741 RepID=A0A6P5AGL0_BRABE|nr:PREDICTED: uncharacterized protein LOC109486195 [Branchiostoma belcheri]